MTWLGKLKGIGGKIDSIAQPKQSEDEMKEQIVDELVEAAAQEAQPAEESKSYYIDTIMPLIRAAEQSVRDKMPETMARLEADHQAQIDGYDFSCIRHGDFLAVFMTREANASFSNESFLSEYLNTKYSTIINLNQVKRIILEKGYPPDLGGVVGYKIGKMHEGSKDEDVADLSEYRDTAFMPPDEGFKHVVTAVTKYNPHPRSFVEEVGTNTISSNYWVYGPYSSRLNYETKDMPRRGVDDRILFSGSNITIFAPAGLGEMVEAKILEALGKGFEPKCIAASLQE